MPDMDAAPSSPTALYRPEQVREIDRRAIEDEGIGDYPLMQRAGAAIFDALRHRWPEARRPLILCGPGNNGGDGYVVAGLARAAGLEPCVVSATDPDALAGAAASARDHWVGGGGTIGRSIPEPAAHDSVVDALLGSGQDRPLSGQVLEQVREVADRDRPVIAVDVPTGLDPDTGAELGEALTADLTVCLIALKRGLFTGRGPALCGDVVHADCDLPASVFDGIAPAAQLLHRSLLTDALQPRARDAHKGSSGHVLVVGGSVGMGGAAILAAEAAARAGAGLVSLAVAPEHVSAALEREPGLMVHAVSDVEQLDPLLGACDVVLVGPGLGQDVRGRSLWDRVRWHGGPVIADADALNLWAADPATRSDWIVTPHPGEAARMLDRSVQEIQSDRFAAVEALAKATGATAVLKGAGSLIADADGRTAVCPYGNPGMAVAGMGDVLGGVIASLWAQLGDSRAAADLGVLVHALAGDTAAEGGERGLLASDLLGAIRRTVNPGASHG